MKTTLTRYLALAGTLSFLLSASSMQAQIVIPTTGYISTIAGDGTSGSTGNGGLATSAELSNNPTAVAVDQTTGDVYIADASNNVIRKVTASTGDISIFAGTGTYGYSGDSGAATSAKLANPHGVAVDTNGNVYIADSSNNRVRMVYKSGLSGLGFTAGDIYTIAGYGPAGYTGDGGNAGDAKLWYPISLAVYVDATYGTLVYVSDWENNYVRQITVGGDIVEYAGHPYNTSVSSPGSYAGNGVTAASGSVYLFGPEGLAVDSYGNLYIANSYNHCIREVMYINAGTDANKIYTVAGEGANYGFSGEGGASTSAKLNSPDGVAVDSSFNVYIADTVNQRIRMVTTTNTTSGSSQTTPLAGNINTIAGNGTAGYGGDGDLASSSSVGLDNPEQLAMDSSNNLYLADTYNYRIRVIGEPFPYY